MLEYLVKGLNKCLKGLNKYLKGLKILDPMLNFYSTFVI